MVGKLVEFESRSARERIKKILQVDQNGVGLIDWYLFNLGSLGYV